MPLGADDTVQERAVIGQKQKPRGLLVQAANGRNRRITPPPAVIVTNPPPPVQWVGAPSAPVSEAYYCRETGQYFPIAQTCVSPWLVVYQR